MSLTYSLLLLLNGFLFYYFRQFLNKDLFLFIVGEPLNSLQYLKDGILSPNIIPFTLISLGTFFLWHKSNYPFVFNSKLKKTSALLLPLIVILILMNQIRHADGRLQLNFETSLMISIKRALAYSKKETLYSSFHRVKVTHNQPAKPFNIVLFVVESWGKAPLSFYGYNENPTPFLTNWIKSESDTFAVFHQAMANASATDVSVPSILTGVGPFESNKKLHRMPIIWDWARGASFQTFLVSSQTMTWLNFDRFILVPGPDFYKTANHIDAPIVNDLGIDDLVMAREVEKILNRLNKQQPFLGVINPNALHAPYQQKSDFYPALKPHPSKYYNALQITDQLFKYIYQLIEKRGQLDDTIFIFTSDHGDYDQLSNPMPRLFCFYDEIMNIPLMIRLPKKYKELYPEKVKQLFNNQNRLINNIDLIPTMTEMLGLHSLAANQKILTQLKGQSLFKPISTDRFTLALNTNDVKSLSPEGFGIYFHQKRFIYTTNGQPGFYDISKDPFQKTNLWSELSDQKKKRVQTIINRHKHLKRIFKK